MSDSVREIRSFRDIWGRGVLVWPVSSRLYTRDTQYVEAWSVSSPLFSLFSLDPSFLATISWRKPECGGGVTTWHLRDITDEPTVNFILTDMGVEDRELFLDHASWEAKQAPGVPPRTHDAVYAEWAAQIVLAMPIPPLGMVVE